MTPSEYNERFAIDHLRNLVRNFDAVNETFNQRFTIDGLIRLHRAWLLSGWDIPPDEWSDRQVDEALLGIVPDWDIETEAPNYETPPRRIHVDERGVVSVRTEDP